MLSGQPARKYRERKHDLDQAPAPQGAAHICGLLPARRGDATKIVKDVDMGGSRNGRIDTEGRKLKAEENVLRPLA
jgi:hypothetical protein